MSPREVVERYFEAMKAGAAGVDELIGLFADDAVYVEPFRGAPQTHEGRAAIAACLRAGVERAPADLTLDVNRVDVDGERVRSEWTCTAPAFPAPVKGVDVCTVRGGLIRRLEVRFA